MALYSISIQNSGDDEQISETLEGVFDAVQKSIKPISIGDPTTNVPQSESMFEVDPAESEKAEQVGINVPEASSQLFEQLSQLVANQLDAYESAGLISLSEDENWIDIDLRAGLLFDTGQYELTNDAVAILIAITALLKQFQYPIVVEGHTDDLPINSVKYTTNWHLSSERASSVVDEMVFRGIAPEKIAPIGFSSLKPQVRNANDFAREQNRRVTLKISKTDGKSVYELLFE
ncbi:OmpA family protein [Marinomonas sp. 15G1-11]|uniref:OmpA family protein n=2 Tax=Marinomonas phaeophyticola TaxID=3004091 RepID=A0ABT4JYF9_9GAMM|nr:OmpA family protein [Marinomonas sp. 15G1-11]MCZ2723313.1 OmpA family protein [Marinomonas sp. 15G1-11]